MIMDIITVKFAYEQIIIVFYSLITAAQSMQDSGIIAGIIVGITLGIIAAICLLLISLLVGLLIHSNAKLRKVQQRNDTLFELCEGELCKSNCVCN